MGFFGCLKLYFTLSVSRFLIVKVMRLSDLHRFKNLNYSDFSIEDLLVFHMIYSLISGK